MADAELQVATQALVAALQAASIESKQLEDGDTPFVMVGPRESRAVRIHCLWFDGVDPSIILARRSRAAFEAVRNEGRSAAELLARHSYRGPVFTLELYDQERLMGEGSVGSASDVVACVRAWLQERASRQIAEEFSFVNDDAGVLRAITPQLDASLRWEFIGAAPFNQLWVYGRGRACQLIVEGAGVGCAFYLGLERAARAASLDDPNAVVSPWLLDQLPLAQLATSVRALELMSRALLLEMDPARRHWLLLRERLVDPDHPLGPLRELISALSDSPIASRFYSFRSGGALQFSASSHLDWVTDRLPYVCRTEAGTYEVAGEFTREIGPAVRLVEDELTRWDMQPFFGSGAHYDHPRLVESLKRQGSALRPVVLQRGDSERLVVARGARECQVIGTQVFLSDGRRRAQSTSGSVDAAARLIRRFLEEGVSIDVVPVAPG